MDDVLKEAIRLRELGFAIHWLWPAQKAPIAAGWNSAPVMTVNELTQSFRRGYNVGFRAGKYSIVNKKEVCVLDVDVRGGPQFEEEAFAVAKTILGGDFSPHVISGSGSGRHQLLGFRRGTAPAVAATILRQSDVFVAEDGEIILGSEKGARRAWMIELLSTGKNVVLPPSIHPDTGKPYRWISGA
jgi:hypothetical protein